MSVLDIWNLSTGPATYSRKQAADPGVVGDPANVRSAMAKIAINALGPREFQVEVSEGGRRTTHRVAVPYSLGDVQLPSDDLEPVVRESFRFLLEREPASSILSRFSLSDITRYFPEYPSELTHRLR
jgi:hypothetical protein